MLRKSEAAANLLSGKLFAQAITAAAELVERNASSLDAINVFPVPDGDTGKNLSLTLRAAAEAAAQEALNRDEPPLDVVTNSAVQEALKAGGRDDHRRCTGLKLSVAGLAPRVSRADQGGTPREIRRVHRPTARTIRIGLSTAGGNHQ